MMSIIMSMWKVIGKNHQTEGNFTFIPQVSTQPLLSPGGSTWIIIIIIITNIIIITISNVYIIINLMISIILIDASSVSSPVFIAFFDEEVNNMLLGKWPILPANL